MSDNGHNPHDGFDAQGGEMWLRRPDDELGAFADEVRDAFVRPAPPALAERHVAAMLAEAQRVTAPTVPDAPPADLATARVPVVRRWTLPRRVAAVAIGTLALGGGMAVAGVRPPEPVSDLLESVGINVPGSDADDQAGRALDQGSDKAEAGGGSQAESGENTANDGATPGAEHANEHAAEGQETAEQARSGQTPPDTPGQSGDHSQSQDHATPPESPGNSADAPHGKPETAPDKSQSSSHDPPEQSNVPDELPRGGRDN